MNHKTIIRALVPALIVFTFGCTQTQQKETKSTTTAKEFKGVIKLDVRESTPDWGPYMLKKAPEGSPNILFILYDDTGLAAWSAYGGAINMPTLDKLAANGLTYTQWHTVALCSPTRSCLLTGRNHNLNGYGNITEGSNGFPGFNARIPEECATIGQVLQDNGWSTFWLGKNHNVPGSDLASGSSRREWPLQKGFDRFYGFIGGETNQWYPDLVEDNHYIEQPYSPEEGYHLSKDLADQAIRMIGDQKSANPSKPWFMWYCPGANHAPHQAPQDYIDKYKGKFDKGYEAYREWVLAAHDRKRYPSGRHATHAAQSAARQTLPILPIMFVPGIRSTQMRRNCSHDFVRSMPDFQSIPTFRLAVLSITWKKAASSKIPSFFMPLIMVHQVKEPQMVLLTKINSLTATRMNWPRP